MEDLEESQVQLQTMLSMRHMGPFRDPLSHTYQQLSDVSETLELWLQVQTLWTSLESVFTGGDIMQDMPLDAKKFAKIDKEWGRLMNRAHATKVVVQAASNDALRTTLPMLFNELERCQKSLEGYLEAKRRRFPRFYFLSNPVLLQVGAALRMGGVHVPN